MYPCSAGELHVNVPEGGEPAEDGEPETPATAKASITQDADGKWNLHLDLSRIVLPTKEEVLPVLLLAVALLLLHERGLLYLGSCTGCCMTPSWLFPSKDAEMASRRGWHGAFWAGTGSPRQALWTSKARPS